jgi:hypothetical protein
MIGRAIAWPARVMETHVVDNQPIKETPVKKRYNKPSLQRLGLLRRLTRFSF